jgi:hypothetical protein
MTTRKSKYAHYTILGVSLTTIMIAVTAVSVAGTVAATAISIYENQQNADYQAKVNKYNADVKANDAKMAQDSAALKAQEIRAQGERTSAEGQNLMAAGGVDTSEGSSLLYQLDTARQTEFAARMAIYSGDVAATGDVAQSQQFKSEADAIESGIAGQTLLTAVGGVGQAAGAAASGIKSYGAAKAGGQF